MTRYERQYIQHARNAIIQTMIAQGLSHIITSVSVEGYRTLSCFFHFLSGNSQSYFSKQYPQNTQKGKIFLKYLGEYCNIFTAWK